MAIAETGAGGADMTPAGADGRAARMPRLLGARLGVALLQAVALYWLTTVATLEPRVWPATSGTTFAPLLLVAIYLPLMVVHGLGEMRPRPLAIWTAVAALAIAGLGVHAATRDAAREL